MIALGMAIGSLSSASASAISRFPASGLGRRGSTLARRPNLPGAGSERTPNGQASGLARQARQNGVALSSSLVALVLASRGGGGAGSPTAAGARAPGAAVAGHSPAMSPRTQALASDQPPAAGGRSAIEQVVAQQVAWAAQAPGRAAGPAQPPAPSPSAPVTAAPAAVVEPAPNGPSDADRQLMLQILGQMANAALTPRAEPAPAERAGGSAVRVGYSSGLGGEQTLVSGSGVTVTGSAEVRAAAQAERSLATQPGGVAAAVRGSAVVETSAALSADVQVVDRVSTESEVEASARAGGEADVRLEVATRGDQRGVVFGGSAFGGAEGGLTASNTTNVGNSSVTQKVGGSLGPSVGGGVGGGVLVSREEVNVQAAVDVGLVGGGSVELSVTISRRDAVAAYEGSKEYARSAWNWLGGQGARGEAAGNVRSS